MLDALLKKIKQKHSNQKTSTIGKVDFGDFRRSLHFSSKKNQSNFSVADYYINKFLDLHKKEIQGNILYSGINRQFFNLLKINNLKLAELSFSNEDQFLADLEDFPEKSFDTVIINQKLQFVFKFNLIFIFLHRIIKPGGILLVNVPGTCYPNINEGNNQGYRRFTQLSVRKLFNENFSNSDLDIKSYGNVLSTISMIYGISAAKLKFNELDFHDNHYPLIISVKSVRK